ncbi:MAG: hypothetical protein MUC87_14180 [Bacteroidia bacterium]|nr:hypothetical protein [Bacteroidia bacterium]
MLFKIIILIFSLLNGGYMLADGIYVLLRGKYIGPPEPGPWAILFRKLNINVFQLGPLFIVFGLCWLVFLAAFVFKLPWAWPAGIIAAVATLWYLPVGTLLSAVVLIILLFRKSEAGF